MHHEPAARSVVSDAETDPASRNEEGHHADDDQHGSTRPELTNIAHPPQQQLQEDYPNNGLQEGPVLLEASDSLHAGTLPGAPNPIMPHPPPFASAAVVHPRFPPPPPPAVGQQMLQFYEAQMRDHAAAYASAAAGAAWAAAQIAADMANASTVTAPNPNIPRALPVPPHLFTGGGPYGGPPPHRHHFIDHNNRGGMPVYCPPGGMDVIAAHPPPAYPPHVMEVPYSAGHYDDGSSNTSDHYGHRRRKRQQRMPPSDPGNRLSLPRPPTYPQPQQPAEKRGRRRRFRPDGSSDTGSDAQQQQQQPSQNNSHQNAPNRRARIRKNLASPNHSSDGGSSGAPTYFNKKKKARQPNDDSLLGKTGSSALYEWCSKRRTTPTFTLEPCDETSSMMTSNNSQAGDSESAPDDERRHRGEFEFSVSIDGMEWGRGRARTKTAAKQEAARRALQTLLPGVAFDEASGILIQLPNGKGNGSTRERTDPAAPWKASTSLEDLAPNLAKRLAIGHADDEEMPSGHSSPRNEDRIDNSKKRPSSKWHAGVYPCASTTTSEDEDENAYYESRGASVCSALLHAMVQIDDRIPEAPNYAYEVATVSAGSGDDDDDGDGSSSQLKRKVGTTGDSLSLSGRIPIRVHRGPFTCTATMRLRRTLKEDEPHPAKIYDLLKAVGIGGSKRDARHTASAKLLALLFPECEGMAQVKEAAEAARERYAGSKALKQQSKRERAFMSKTHRWNQSNENAPSLIFAVGSKDPKLPVALEDHLLAGLGFDRSLHEKSPEEESAITSRQLSRQKQLDDRIAAATLTLNEHDDEGRSLPDEPTVDDVVGRTVLRRATPEDLNWISMLLDGAKFPLSPVSVLGPTAPAGADEEAAAELTAAAVNMWSSSAIVLLLCRAIAPFEDPPLGCAVLTLGFSMEKGRLLRVAQIGSKPHLPRERLIECLQSFADCMQCCLETKEMESPKPSSSSLIKLRHAEIQTILTSHLSTVDTADLDAATPWFLSESSSPPKARKPHLREESLVAAASPLQSVQEESEGVEESGAESGPEKRVAKKDQDKPSKRSRVQ